MYIPFNKVVFRFPRYPISFIDRALVDDSFYREIIGSRDFQEAIFLASPSLYDELKKSLCKTLNLKDEKRLHNTLIRYLSRMSTRCTPFGTFSGISIGTFSDNNATDIQVSENINKKTRLDMLYLCNLSQKLSQVEEVKQGLRYFVNTSLYPKGNKFRYIEYYFMNSRRIHQLVEIQKTYALSLILKKAESGTYISDMIMELTSTDNNISDIEASIYIDELINSQVLLSEIDPFVTGNDFFKYMISIITPLEFKPEVKEPLLIIDKLLDKIEYTDSDNRLSIYTKIENEIQKLEIPYDKKFLFQVDSIYSLSKGCINNDIATIIQDCLQLLAKITPSYKNQRLEEFIAAFSERYEEREVLLIDALDPELGLGYPVKQYNDLNFMIDDLQFPSQFNEHQTVELTPFQLIIQKKILNMTPFQEEISIEDEDIKGFKKNNIKYPATLAVLFQLIQTDADQYRLSWGSCGGSTAGNLLGRFAYCNDSFRSLVSDITEKEKEAYQDAIVAEVSHLPDSRIGNILARPTIRDYEILYLANSSRPRNEIIPLSDLYLSIKNNQLILRSKKLNRIIVPRLTTAHNYSTSPIPIYLFLCDLQYERNAPSFYLDLGILENLDYRPRIVYKKTILSLARWKIGAETIQKLFKIENEKELLTQMKIWIKRYKLPKQITLIDSDNKLYINTHNIKSIQSFLSIIKNRNQIILEEFIQDKFEDNDLTSYDKKEKRINECIAFFYKKNK